MSGRINPREYDLGELRDAAREASRRGVEATGAADHPESGTGPRGSLAPGSDAAPPESASEDGTADRGEPVSAAEDPEAYLRSRHRRNRPAGGPSLGTSGRRDGGPLEGTSRDRNGSGPASPADDPNVDFEFLSHGAEGGTSRPYLEELPGDYGAQLEIFEWLDGLVSRGGREGTIEALEYYESVEWLSTESRTDLEEFVAGLGTEEAADGSLGISDHRESLSYIARLAGRRRR
jgi:hypothetical protein